MNIQALLKKIEKHSPKSVYLQFPEGLKTRVLEMAEALEQSGVSVFIGCDPCYGACDLRDREALSLGCDLLVHIGHADFGVKAAIPVVYEDYQISFNPTPLLEKHPISFRRIALFTTVQFRSSLPLAEKFLGSKGKKIAGSAVVLGCNQSAALALESKADCFLFLGSGKFHPLGLALKTEKPVLSLDFEAGKLLDFEQEKKRLLKIRAFRLEQAKEARNFGILVSTKPGQSFPEKALAAKRALREKGRNAWILAMDELSPSKLLGLEIDALVNTACPRLLEDSFKKPVIGPEDIGKLCEGLY